MQFFSIKFKIIFQKIRYNVEISLSSIADKKKMVSFDKIGLYGSLEIFWVRPHLCHTFVAIHAAIGIWMYRKKIFIKL